MAGTSSRLARTCAGGIAVLLVAADGQLGQPARLHAVVGSSGTTSSTVATLVEPTVPAATPLPLGDPLVTEDVVASPAAARHRTENAATAPAHPARSRRTVLRRPPRTPAALAGSPVKVSIPGISVLRFPAVDASMPSRTIVVHLAIPAPAGGLPPRAAAAATGTPMPPAWTAGATSARTTPAPARLLQGLAAVPPARGRGPTPRAIARARLWSPRRSPHPSVLAPARVSTIAPGSAGSDPATCDAGCAPLRQRLVAAAMDPRGAERLAGADRIDALRVPPLPPHDSCDGSLMGPALCHATDAAAEWIGDHKLDVATTAGMLAVQAVPVADVAADAVAGARAAEAVGDGTSFAEAQGLRRSLTSEEQMRGPGEPIAGRGTDVPLRNAQRLASDYGGDAAGWRKMKSPYFTVDAKRKFETHWYENVQGQRFEPKVKLGGPWFGSPLP